jgi:hypothetical protein
MATVLSARKTRNVRNAARFPRSIPIVTYLYIYIHSTFRVCFWLVLDLFLKGQVWRSWRFRFFVRIWEYFFDGKLYGRCRGRNHAEDQREREKHRPHRERKKKKTRETKRNRAIFLDSLPRQIEI